VGAAGVDRELRLMASLPLPAYVFPPTGEFGFYVDPSRCIGCQACFNACAECDTHRGAPMIHVDYLDRSRSMATVPTVCMHCDDPTCAEVCPADAIKKSPDGVVQSSLKPRCIACSNCVLACPFGVPKMMRELEQMMKCDMCYDRTSVGKRPMCATVCPSQALAYVPPATIARSRREVPTNFFRFGNQVVTTRVYMMTPPGIREVAVDVVDYMWETP
jgi:Fe-S-cluster-containing dehydrogenase component